MCGTNTLLRSGVGLMCRPDEPPRMALTPRTISFIGLVALLPVAAYMLSDSFVVALSLVCVLVIVGSMYTMFGPSEGAFTGS